MEREYLIEEYRRLFEKRQSLTEEIEDLAERIRALQAEREFDRRWLNAVEERFDSLYGCESEKDSIPWHLHVYIEKGMEVPE